MTSKEFNILIALILEMLKNNQTEKVIELLEEAIGKEKNNDNINK